MLYTRWGRSIAEKFLVPYNEKVYATDLATLDENAMGRFFPHADLTEVMRNMKVANNASYNSTFIYPEGGAIEFINALASSIRPGGIALDEPLIAVDLERRVARTSRREIAFERLVSTAPFNRLLDLVGLRHDPTVWSWNKVLVYNFGFDRKGPRDVHWIYYPDPACAFYRIGFYDNIFDTKQLSTYVEIGLPSELVVDEAFLERTREQVLRRHAATRGDYRSRTYRRALCGHGSSLRSPDAGLNQRTRASGNDPERIRCVFDWPLRRMDLLLNRGQYRRGTQAGGALSGSRA